MKPNLRSAASAAAFAALACTAPAAAQLTMDPGLKLTLTAGEWRTSTGYEGSVRAGTEAYVFNGFARRPGDDGTEELGLRATARDRFAGPWLRYDRGRPSGQGTYTLSASSDMMVGTISGPSGETRPFLMCKRPGTGGWSAFDGTELWTRRVSAKRSNGTKEVTAVLELQYVREGERTYDLSRAVANLVGSDGKAHQAGQARGPDGSRLATRTFEPCGHQLLHFTWSDMPLEVRGLEFRIDGRPVAALSLSLPPAYNSPPEPNPAPAPSPTPAPAPAPTPVPGGLAVPAGAAGFVGYGPWAYKVDELVRGPDGHIQAVFTVRNASRQRLPFGITDFEAHLIDADGRSVRRLGNLYRAAPTGPAAALSPAGSSYLEPGDEMRGRILFPGTKGFEPAQLRLKEPVRSLTVNTYPLR